MQRKAGVRPARRRPKLDGFTEIIDRWLLEDLAQRAKQRREHRRRSREMFVPLHHPPGNAQADFGEAAVVIGGVEQTAHFFAFDLPQSDACLFQLISQRYERGSTLITSNLPFDEWTETFGSERLTGALLDRLTHQVTILEMNGDSYRLAESRARKTTADA